MSLFFSCQNENVIDNGVNTVESIRKNDADPTKFEEAKVKIENMGFDTSSMYEEDGFYVVEGDILLNKISIDDIDKSRPELRQYRATNYVANFQKITIGVDATISTTTNWRTAVNQAITAYNQNTGLKFTYSETNPDIKITKIINSSLPGVYAQGEFPATNLGKPGTTIQINYGFSSGGISNIDNLTLGLKTYILIHELGHNLGLMHTDQGQGTLIQGTPTTDPNSFMNSSVSTSTVWTDFSTYDKIALNALWPSHYIVSFASGSHSSISVDPGSFLDRSITPPNPMSSSSVFCGWYKDASLTNPWNLNSDMINSNITLYPKWRTPTGFNTLETNSNVTSSVSFTVNQTTTVSLTARVGRGLWEWWEISQYSYPSSGSGAYAIIGYQGGIRKIVDMASYILNASPDTYQEHTEYVVLDAGTHWLAAGFPTALGPQNGASTKHGITYATVQY